MNAKVLCMSLKIKVNIMVVVQGRVVLLVSSRKSPSDPPESWLCVPTVPYGVITTRKEMMLLLPVAISSQVFYLCWSLYL